MKKIYTIRILQLTHKRTIWYRTRRLEEFNATLGIIRGKVFFIVDSLHHVDPDDCVVVAEKFEEIYTKDKY
jgi:hypothetical protein